MKKQWIILCGVLTAVLGLAGCSQKTSEVSLYDRGLETVSLVCRMAQDEDFQNTISRISSDEITKTVRGKITANPTAPAQVYEVSVSDEALMENYGLNNGDGISGEFRGQLLNRCYSNMDMRLLAIYGGSLEIAAASMYEAVSYFTSEELEQNKALLFTYQDGAPILVTYILGEDNAVTASGTVLPCKEFQNSEKLGEYFEALGAKLTKYE